MDSQPIRDIPIHKLLTFTSPDAGEMEWRFNDLSKNHPLYIPGAACYILYGQWGCMIFQHIAGNYFDIWLSHYDVCKPCTFYTSGDIAVIECCFEVANEKVHVIQPLHPVLCRELTYNLYYFSAIRSSLRFKGDLPITTLDIHCHPSMLEKLQQTTPKRIAPILDLIKSTKTNGKNDPNDNITSARAFREPQHCTPIIKKTLAKLFQELHSKGANADLHDLVYPLLHDSLAKDEDEHMPPAANAITGIPELCHRMRTEFPKRYTIDALADMVYMSRRTFYRSFKSETGTTPNEFYRTVAMQTAAHLLENTLLPVFQIADRAGFSSESAFSRAFLRHFSTTPSNHRRKSKRK